MTDKNMARSRRVLFVAPEDWFFASHFLGLARAAQAAGYEIGLATRINAHRELLEAAGIRLFPLQGKRSAMGLGQALGEIAMIRAAIRDFRPGILHLIALRAIVLGRAASIGLPIECSVMAPTGLGYLFSRRTLLYRLARSTLKRVIRWSILSPRNGLLVENHDDPNKLGIPLEHPRLTIIGGAGIDPQVFAPQAEPAAPPVRFAVVARMLRSKGIAAAVEAFSLAQERQPDIELHLYGDVDPANPTSYSRAEMGEFIARGRVFWHGFQKDVPAIWRDNHVAMLLTDREGMPRTLAEAAASARPLIATDVPGCREIVENGVNGFLVPHGQREAARDAILRLAEEHVLRERMGAASRTRFEAHFTLERVSSLVLALYARLGAGQVR